MSLTPPWSPEYAAENSSQPLVNVCISFGILETFFIIAFVFSWHYNRRNSNSSKTFYLLILFGYVFCFGGVVVGIRMDSPATVHGKTPLIMRL